eukprot:15394411-Alexandrium_andersonii.AAC.1
MLRTAPSGRYRARKHNSWAAAEWTGQTQTKRKPRPKRREQGPRGGRRAAHAGRSTPITPRRLPRQPRTLRIRVP